MATLDSTPQADVSEMSNGKLTQPHLFQGFIVRADGTHMVIPNEIFQRVLEIFHERQDVASLICLSLVKKIFWNFKNGQLHEGFSTLTTSSKIDLAPLLETWVGPEFRVCGWKTMIHGASYLCNVMYVSKRYYTEHYCGLEVAMVERYKDRQDLNLALKYVSHTMSSPFGQGYEWNRQEFICILKALFWEQRTVQGWLETLSYFFVIYKDTSMKMWVDEEWGVDEDISNQYDELQDEWQIFQRLEEQYESF